MSVDVFLFHHLNTRNTHIRIPISLLSYFKQNLNVTTFYRRVCRIVRIVSVKPFRDINDRSILCRKQPISEMFERKSEVLVRTPPEGVWYQGYPLEGTWARDTPPERTWDQRYPPRPLEQNRMTDACENITFPPKKLSYVGHDRLHWILHQDLIVKQRKH